MIKIVISENTYMTRQRPTTDNLVHYRNIFADPENFIKRKVDYSKMKVFDEKYRKEFERLKTFENASFPDKLMVRNIAKSGFYYKKISNSEYQVRCIYCQGNIPDWKKNDIPVKRHKYSYPTCPYIIYLNVGNEPLENEILKESHEDPDVTRPTMEITIYIQNLKLKMIDQLNDIDYLDVDNREQTFELFPDLKYMALKGFFIVEKVSDKLLKCGSCLNEILLLKGVENLSEHIIHKDDCKYMNIDEYLKSEIEVSRYSNEEFCDVEFSLAPEEIEARVEMKSNLKLIGLEINREQLKSVLNHKLKTTGKDFDSLFELFQELKKGFNARKQPKIRENEFTLTDYPCVVCLDKSVEVVFLPCGHLKTCENCSEMMTSCPVCRLHIEKRVRRIRFYNQ